MKHTFKIFSVDLTRGIFLEIVTTLSNPTTFCAFWTTAAMSMSILHNLECPESGNYKKTDGKYFCFIKVKHIFTFIVHLQFFSGCICPSFFTIVIYIFLFLNMLGLFHLCYMSYVAQISMLLKIP